MSDGEPGTALGIEPFERPLRVFAFDPSRGRTPANVVTLRLPYERLEPGPVGQYLAVIDYNQSLDRTYEPVDLGALDVVLRGGRDPSELDFQFHQQMVYAVASRTIQAFEQALGRPIRWPWATSAGSSRVEDKLRIYPHAQRIANAWVRPDTGELFFGYDSSQADAGGRGGQLVFSCLAYDIVAHETVHPLLHAVVPKTASTSSDDSRAFQEGFADLIALLQHFDFEHALLDAVLRTNGRIWELTTAPDITSQAQALIQAERAGTNPLLEIGRQFGQATGLGGAIRTALGSPPDPAAFPSTEPHQRGAILVAAVFDALFSVYARRIRDLLRVGGVRGRDDPLHPDLARRLAGEARATAHRFLDLCIRALDYCPPVDIDFGDYLRALVTLDAEVSSGDDWGCREALLEGFRARGIGADGVLSYSEEGLRWPRHDGTLPRCQDLRLDEAEAGANHTRLHAYAHAHREALGLDPKLRLELSTPVVRTSQRVGSQGQLQREFIVQITQGRHRQRGTTLILDQQGAPRYIIAKPPGGGGQARARASAGRTRDPLEQVPQGQHGQPPDRRPLKIFAFDPTRGRGFGNRLLVSVPYERLAPGPVGRQIAVVDYDASNDRYYDAVDLEDPGILLGGGLDPTDLTPQFSQQMVYAVAAATIERFELGLARPVVWRWARRGQRPLASRLLIHPHAMQEANAYYDRGLHALLFGYFTASEDAPGSNLPGQIVHTCLSHDIVVHETTHAVVDSIRPYFLDRTGPDAAAFHEAFADIIALLEHFSFPEALQETIQRTGGQIHNLQFGPETRAGPAGGRIAAERPTSNPLVELARQFGEALGSRAALRSALGTAPDSRALERTTEAHERGAILVAAVFDAFFSVYIRRTADLLRLARAGGAVTRWGDLNPDLATRLAREATSTAERFTLMCVRALDYCPPVDLELGDFLRSLITADFEVEPDDPLGYRAALVDAFSARGIYPAAVHSLSEEALLWHRAEVPPTLRCAGLDLDPSRPDSAQRNAVRLREFARDHAAILGLSASAPINVRRVQSTTSHRVDPHGNLRPEFHVQLEQRRMEPVDPDDPGSAAFVFRGGATAVLDHTGSVRYLIGKRIDDPARLRRQREHLREVAGRGPAAAYQGAMVRPLQLAALHRGLDA